MEYVFFYCYTMHFNSLNLNIATIALLYTIIQQSKMSVLKHLKTFQHVSIIIHIIFRERVGSLLKSLNLKFFRSFLKLWRLFVVMRQHKVWCVCTAAYLSTQKATHTHQTLCCHIATNYLHNFTELIKTFKFSDFNKETTSQLKMI